MRFWLFLSVSALAAADGRLLPLLSQHCGSCHGGSQSQGGLSEEQLEELEEQFSLDKNVFTGYGQWLGIAPRETRISKTEFGSRGEETIGGGVDVETTAVVVLRGMGEPPGERASSFLADSPAVGGPGQAGRHRPVRARDLQRQLALRHCRA